MNLKKQFGYPAKRGPLSAGFTLIELLVVVLIIGILSSVALPQYTKAVEKARSAEAMTMLSNLHKAAMIYDMENGEHSGSGEDFLGDSANRKDSFSIDISSGLDCSVESGKACASKNFIYSVSWMDSWTIIARRRSGDYYFVTWNSTPAKSWSGGGSCVYESTLGKSICTSLKASGWSLAV